MEIWFIHNKFAFRDTALLAKEFAHRLRLRTYFAPIKSISYCPEKKCIIFDDCKPSQSFVECYRFVDHFFDLAIITSAIPFEKWLAKLRNIDTQVACYVDRFCTVQFIVQNINKDGIIRFCDSNNNQYSLKSDNPYFRFIKTFGYEKRDEKPTLQEAENLVDPFPTSTEKNRQLNTRL